ncbi:MAG: class I SAM-dependent methyltransferase [Anaerolineales bacterium]|nr:class I SAM-dependent methyltransferase [Anaerolineales bacterium]
MTSVPFDRAVSYYDRTRDLPDEIARAGIQAMLDQLQAHRYAHILEVGAGTGRISIPLLERGAQLVGVDLSQAMLGRLREKYGAARVAQADAVDLPFPSRYFDGLLTVHLLHLVGGWRLALREFARVLKPGGVYVNSWNWHAPSDVDARVRDYWRGRVEAHGGEWRRPGIQEREELLAEVRDMGAAVEELSVVRFFPQVTASEVIEGIAERLFSDTWNVPDDILAASVRELREWAKATLGDLNRPQLVERRFLLDVVRFRP